MSEVAIKVEDLWKKYRLGQAKSTSFRESVGQFFTRSEKEYFWALKEIDFEVKRGEAVGIIGKNGAGKSTLLKVLSKITYPTKGRIEINGRISSLLEVGTGFHPELTGRQNVFLNGSILGMTKKEIQSKFDEIVAFSGVEKFIDTPVKHYSSGMKVRLAFSVAAHLEPEILIIDEVLAVGDAEFQKKCLGRMEDVAGEGRTVLFVSHNMSAVRSLCRSGIVLSEGKISVIDAIEPAVEHYLDLGKHFNSKSSDLKELKYRRGEGNYRFTRLTFQDSKSDWDFGQPLEFKTTIHCFHKEIGCGQDVDLGVAVMSRDQRTIVHVSNRFIQKKLIINSSTVTYQVSIDTKIVSPGDYCLTLFLRVNGIIEDWIEEVGHFKILDGNPYEYANTEEIKGLIMPAYSITQI